MNIKQAKSIAFGSKPAESLEQYYGAWQWLYNNEVLLRESDYHYMWKLIENGYVIGEESGIHWTTEIGGR